MSLRIFNTLWICCLPALFLSLSLFGNSSEVEKPSIETLHLQ